MPDEIRLREQAREAIRSGKLPSRRPDRTSSGPGSDVTCAVCGALVKRDQVEIEIEFKRHGRTPRLDRYLLHLRCHAAWEFERTNILAKRRPWSTPPPSTIR
jgi:hypothetical protein